MGFALARELLRAGRSVTVWNRTLAKAEALQLEGAAVAPSAAAAVKAAPVVVVCVADYVATYAALEKADLTGKVLVQLSTCTPQEARDGEAWMTKRGADYLDGAILAVPSQMGSPESTIFVSGSETAFGKSEALLKNTAGTIAYMGTKVGAASALDLAFLSHLFCGLIGFYHSARICESEGISVGDLGAMFVGLAPAIGGMVKHDADRVQAESYARPQSSLETCARATDLLLRHAGEAKLDTAVAAFAAAIFERGRAAGFGDESPAALVKVLRAAAPRGEKQ
jgi:3-hydroxyisobutyrate dehydrogenase-like beta-hydroxyacid dehydrogenase